MTPQAQRIAIAEACQLRIREAGCEGWYCKECSIYVKPEHVTYEETHDPRFVGCGGEVDISTPDYLNDLNAMHEAEKYFDDKPVDVRSLWLDTLAVCCKWPTTKNALDLKFEVEYLQARSTAAQRAEAFLRTLGLWTD